MSYETTGFTFMRTLISSEEFTKDVVFECENFIYSARCYQNIIQFIKGQRHTELLTNGQTPTEEQHIQHDLRRELYNGDHQPLQDWIDNLNQ
jgi:hypothetical protein